MTSDTSRGGHGVALAAGERLGPLRRAGEVEAELLLLGEADELPHVGERPPVVVPQLVEDGAARRADAQRVLKQFHQLLVGQPPRERLDGRAQLQRGAGEL